MSAHDFSPTCQNRPLSARAGRWRLTNVLGTNGLKAAVKWHRLLDLCGNSPAFVPVSHGKLRDVTVLDQLPIEPGTLHVMD